MRTARKTAVLAGLVALGAASGCASGPKLVVPQTPVEIFEPTPVVAAAAEGAAETEGAAAPEPSRCGEPIPGWRAFAKPGKVVVLGEYHGSNEIPAFAIDAACQAAEAGLSVHLNLEIARWEQPLVDDYLRSEGTPEDRTRLLSGGMWHRIYEDGRSSRAIADVIDRARTLRRAGLPIQIHYYDEPTLPGGSNKEKRLAANVIDLWNASPRDLHIVLTGNTHARTVIGVQWDKKFEPMGYHLVRMLPDVLVLDAQYSGGEAWYCELSKWGKRVKCGAKPARPPFRMLSDTDVPRLADGRPASRYAGTFLAPSEEGYHGVFFVGRLSAAAPAEALFAGR